MGPVTDIGFAKLKLQRGHESFRLMDEAEIATLRATSNRFFDYILEETDRSDKCEKSFACTDQAEFLDRIGASPLQKTYLEGTTLRLRVVELADAEARICELVADWSTKTNPPFIASTLIMGFLATDPNESAQHGPLSIVGDSPIGFRNVEPNSSELDDIAAIADFFPPVH